MQSRFLFLIAAKILWYKILKRAFAQCRYMHKEKNLQGKNTCEVWKHALFRFLSYLIIKRIDIYVCIHSVQSLSHVRLFATTWTAAQQASLSINNTQIILKLMSIESVMPYNHLILCGPLLLMPSIFPSIGVFSNE